MGKPNNFKPQRRSGTVDTNTDRRGVRLLGQAREHLKQNRLPEAERAFREVLKAYPDHFEALHLLGVTAAQQKKLDEACRYLELALEQNPQSFLANNNLGLACHEMGHHEKALECFDSALRIKPNDPSTLARRGLTLQALSRHIAALECYDRAIELNPRFVEALHNRGNVLAALERYEDALLSFNLALGLNPNIAETHNSRGSALHALGRLEEALASYDKAIVIRPIYDEALNNRGNVLRELGRHTEARTSYERALAIDPENPDALNRQAGELSAMSRFEDAIATFDRALALKPDFAQALYNRGNALTALNRLEEAVASYERALAAKPTYANALNNRGAALQGLNRHEEAIASYEQVLKITPDDAGAHFNASLARLTLGEFLPGWEEYEWRWKAKHFTSQPRNFTQPLWLGNEALEGKTILLHAEQGFGDTLQFVRYVPMVAELGARVLLEVPNALRPLFSSFNCVERVIAKGEPVSEFDFHCPLMSLPLAFRTTLENIPREVPYLSAPPSRIQHWQQQLGPAAMPRVGVVWSGRLTHRNDHNRSIPLSTLLTVAGDGIELVSLQKEVRSEDQATLAQRHDIRHFGEELRDFSDTAALISLMDVVISVDTAPAHLAGALGKPIWILLPFRPDWRWLLDREDSPWYPTARLFRQPAIGEWDSVIQKMRKELASNFGMEPPFSAAPEPSMQRIAQTSQIHQQSSSWNNSRLLNRAAVLLKEGNLTEAEHLFQSILATSPRHFEALHLLGVCKGKQGKHEEAYALFDEAVKINPHSAEALKNHGFALAALNRGEEAIASFQRARSIRPNDTEVLGTLGNALAKLNRHEDAITIYDRLLEIVPGAFEIHYNRGNSYQALSQHEKAIKSYQKALTIRPDFPEALNNCGNSLQAIKRHRDAIESFQKALALQPDKAEAHYNEGLARLALGDLPAGWEKYEWRWKKRDFTSPQRRFKQPVWLGKEPLAGKTILLHAEQGFGDAIQFVRYVDLVSNGGARVFLEVQAPLRRLFDNLKGVEKIFVRGEALPAFDLHCPLMSLPLAFRTTLDTIPSRVPYLNPSRERLLDWSERLGPRRRFRVGVCWSGRATHQNDRNRSIALGELLPLACLDLDLVSLQKESSSDDQVVLAQTGVIRQFGEELQDFEDTAALISLMDVAISVDTAVAHLAGALGKPVWLLLPFAAEWRWLVDREDSPWYPTARLFRQAENAEWESVVRRVALELKKRFELA